MTAAHRLRLVVVDNDQAVLDLLLLDLRLEGHDVVATAMSGDEAVQRCEQHEPDVLVVDLRLGPGMNGLDVARRVASPDRRVVLFTNYITPSVIRDAREAGATLVEKGNLTALRRAVEGTT